MADSLSTESCKKDFSIPMDDKYLPASVEKQWDAFWESCDLYKPDDSKDDRFVIVLPPPNVTGSLHLGHALTAAIQDAVVRFHRMSGKSVLWVPGLDHAGIATQAVVEKQLKKDHNLSRHDLGREKFVERVWEWKEEYGGNILTQLRSLGASLDWSRTRFTLDEICQKAVLEAFLKMYEAGIIYRDNRLVSWSCALKSAISSIEVDHLDVSGSTMITVPGFPRKVEVGVIHEFAYKVKDSDEELVVATTRIETMLGDVAVAVNSKDPRYTHLVGKELIHPFIANRKITVITDDELVDMDFGTGAVKITPAHDPNDYACGVRHNLEFINILDDDGTMNEHAGEKYHGMHRFEVREQIIDDLIAVGSYKGKKDNPMAIGLCSRSNDLIEPLIKPQWWVSCQGMAQRGIDAVANGDLTILPASGVDAWNRWLSNIQDWCISRQLWWGHRIPAFYVLPEGLSWPVEREDKSRWVIARDLDEAKQIAAQKFPGEKYTIHQDEDVLDTWFSSGLFPFSVMGWPDQTPDLEKYFPGDLLETGGDILFFWVARMVMMSLQLTDQLPFHTVYLHSLVRDRLGRKMSKSLGNVVDPVDVIKGCTLDELYQKLVSGNLSQAEVKTAGETQKAEFPQGIPECGADALRFGLLTYTKQGGDINLDMNVIVSSRHFCNKMWQAARFALMNFGEWFIAPINGISDVQQHIAAAGGIRFEQEWILYKLARVINIVHEAYHGYEFSSATSALQSFFVDDLCSRYLEIIKSTVKSRDTPEGQQAAQSVLSVLYYCLDSFLRLLHPMMPFVTEELYHRLPGHQQQVDAAVKARPGDERAASGSIMIAEFPKKDVLDMYLNDSVDSNMTLLISIIDSIRSVKSRLNISRHVHPQIYLECTLDKENPQGESIIALIQNNENVRYLISTLSAVSLPVVVVNVKGVDTPESEIPNGTLRTFIDNTITLHLELDKNTDFSAELIKNEKKLEEVQEKLDSLIKINSTLQLAIQKDADAGKDTTKKVEVYNKNSAAISQHQTELVVLHDNITAYRSVVSRPSYVKNLLVDLRNTVDLTTKAMVKLQAVVDNAKKPSAKHIELIEKYRHDIDAVNDRIAILEKELETF